MGVANEFNITSPKELAVLHCIESIISCVEDIKVNNFKDMLQLVHLTTRRTSRLKGFQFAKRNAVKVLTIPEIMNLRNEDEVLWEELKNGIIYSADSPITSREKQNK